MTAIICTVISAILGGWLVARFSSRAARVSGDAEELILEIGEVEKHLHKLREISSRNREQLHAHQDKIAVTSSNVQT